MNLAPVILVAVVVAADSSPRLIAPPAWATPSLVTALALGVPALLVLVAAAVTRAALGGTGSARAMLRGVRLTRLVRWATLATHGVVVLWLGWLGVVRSAIGDLVLVDELICLTPPVATLLAIFWVHYPIELRLRQAVLLRTIDAGRPVYALPPRGAYVLFQARSALLLLGLPLVLIIGAAELIETASRTLSPEAPAWIEQAGTLVAAALIFVASPVLARLVLHVRPLPAGVTRDDLTGVCTRHGVRVRDILVWDTGGAMINAAVMGLVGRLRYVLLTDALLDSMSRDQLVAVMAHEVAHVRRRHIPWLVVALLATLSAAFLVVQLPIAIAGRAGWLVVEQRGVLVGPVWAETLVFAAQVTVALVAFGWISRRFERQADTFSVQHLSGLGVADEPDTTVAPEAVAAMHDALDRIAQLNTIDRRKPSWRHGSIEWRQDYLSSIVGQPIRDLAIDRLVRSIKLATGVVLAGAILAELLLVPASFATSPGPTHRESAFNVVQGSPERPPPR